ncbi:transposase [Weizmannia coagulans]|uniref:Transposase IS4 family protein n=13 Tax=Heyndrickxia TaxID=2837504 RepID=A0A0C5C488_HEYCO|nr:MULTISPECIES: transposase [Heyndrickxia]AJO21429.1 transposase IS4 family protein [Heyndrickxia coagulans]AJO21755.1 transposase IS4 family protein [Heyndrickxia coagulans]AJO21829.1 transposase IS4 family protein [Heyndrickxia coagulans]AJO22031.1 transposase IS4 family protein [Heyndrickxia coagulans]AJO22086.1 transposase IS4 family protein [Heyndrickxia coagulans]
MIAKNSLNNQLPNEIKSTFKELNMLKHLRIAGITKSFGFSCAYIFQLIFCMIFENKNWFRMLESKKATDIPAKDTVYRFLNQSTFNWRRFLLSLVASVIGKVSKLTRHDRPKVLILDDSSYDRNRSKHVELLARCFDHASQKMRFYKGFRMLTLGWSDGATFLPVDFSLLSSKKSQINGISENIDKRSSGYKRRKEALQTAPEQIPGMIARAMNSGIDASYVLMDSWFTQQPLIKEITEQGLDVIGMVKKLKQRYFVDGKRVSLDELYRLAKPTSGKKGILRSIHTTQANGVPIKVVFVRNRNKKSDWLAILSTDCTLSDQEIIRIYGMRWDIEVFFKTTKSLLKLQKEFQSRSYDALISHTTIVFARYIVLSWQNRCSVDDRTLGGMFYELCDEIDDLDWAVALQQLVEILEDTLDKSNKKIQQLIKSQLQQWIAGLPNYIKVYLPVSVCES